MLFVKNILDVWRFTEEIVLRKRDPPGPYMVLNWSEFVRTEETVREPLEFVMAAVRNWSCVQEVPRSSFESETFPTFTYLALNSRVLIVF